VQKLKEMVQVVKQHLRGYLPDIIELIKQFWRLREAAVLRRGSGAERTPARKSMNISCCHAILV